MLNIENINNIFLPTFSLAITTELFFLLTSLLTLYFLIVKALYLYKSFSQSYKFIGIKPTDRTLKTAVSTKQLFIILHSHEKPHSLFEKLIGFRKNISFELISGKAQGIRYILRIPKEDLSTVKKTLLAYLPGIEINEIDDYLNQGLYKTKSFKLQNDFIYPLSVQPNLNIHDPLAYLTAHLTKLNENEQIAIHFIATPINSFTHAYLVRRIKNIKGKLLKNEDINHYLSSQNIFSFAGNLLAFLILTPVTLISWFVNNTKSAFPVWLFNISNGNSSKGTIKTDLYNSINNKLNQPLFEVSIRIAISQNTTNYTNRFNGIYAAFDTFSTSFQSIKFNKNTFEYINSKFIARFKQFILKNRLPIFRNNIILSVEELSDLYHLPYTDTTKTEDLLQVKSPKLPAPISLKQNADKFDITFAYNTYGETTTPIGLTLEERRRHSYIIGATGTGKTTLLMHMISQDINKGNGLAIIDPHGDLAEKLLGIIPEERIKDVVYFNPYDVEYPIGLNVLELPKDLSGAELQREKDFITSSLISVFHKLYDERYSGPRMEHILRNVILTALEQEKPTLFTIYNLLTNSKYRKSITALLEDEILKSFWKNEFDKLGSYQKAEQISPITNKLGRFLTTSMTRNILNQSESKFDFEKIMNKQKILICNLSKGKIGEDTAYFLGGLITAKIQLTALRRVHIKEEERKDFFLYIDEFQNFATMSFAQILSEARKYRLSVILAHQNTVQIENDLLETIMGNTGTLISFRTTSPKDESKLLPIFAPEVEKGQIANLPSYNFYMKINALQPQNTFSGEIEPFDKNFAYELAEKIIFESRISFSNKIKIYKQITHAKKFMKIKISSSKNIFEVTE